MENTLRFTPSVDNSMTNRGSRVFFSLVQYIFGDIIKGITLQATVRDLYSSKRHLRCIIIH